METIDLTQTKTKETQPKTQTTEPKAQTTEPEPNLAKATTFQMIGSQRLGANSTQVYRAGSIKTTTQYTGFTFFVTTTMTGTVSVYGYNK
jgi:hypothetical protein